MPRNRVPKPVDGAPAIPHSGANGVKVPGTNGARCRRRQQPSPTSIVDEVARLKGTLRDALSRSNQLLHVVREQRQRDRVVNATLKSLRKLQQTDN